MSDDGQKWAAAIADALGDHACAGRSREELAARVADMRRELEREKRLRRAAETVIAERSPRSLSDPLPE